jgi:hypothetical protein
MTIKASDIGVDSTQNTASTNSVSTQYHTYSRRNFLGLLGKGIAGAAIAGGLTGLISCSSGNEKLHTDSDIEAKTERTVRASTQKPELMTKKLDPENGHQNPLKQQIALTEIITYKLYDEQFLPISGADETVAKELYKYTLDDLVQMKALSSKNEFQKDLWITLGLRDTLNINFYNGMEDSWNDKLNRFSKKLTSKQKGILEDERDESLHKLKKPTLSSLRVYRSKEIAEGITMLKELSENYLNTNHTGDSVRQIEMRRLVKNISSDLSENVLLGYNIHELLPPSFDGKKINAVAKAHFLNGWLKDGGREVLERFPARYDIMLSYGPFQLTKWAMSEVSQNNLNSYVSQRYKSPSEMAELNKLQEHVNAAVKFAFANWLRIGDTLADNGKLKRFNEGYENMNSRDKKILLSGITACMHHKPKETRAGVIKYLSNNSGKNSMNEMHHELCSSLEPQLKK